MAKKILKFPLGSSRATFVKEKKVLDEFESARPAYTEVTKYTADGEVITDCVFRSRSQNGSGFVISYTEKMLEFVEKHSSASVVRMFMYFAHNQKFGDDGIYGYRCSRKHLETILGVDRKTVYNALQVLKSEFLVIETKVDGVSEFMVNPNYITIGRNKGDRIREWNLRWEQFFKSGGKV